MSLLAHCDTKRVGEDVVAAVPAPPFTETWHPYSHAEIIQSLVLAVDDIGVGVRDRQYSINKSGTRCFSCWDLDLGDSKTGFSVGWRNSIDKSMVLGFCSGTRVFVCDNLALSGSYTAFKVHNASLTLETLDLFVKESLKDIIAKKDEMLAWQNGLQDVWVPRQDYKALVYDMVERDVFSGGQIQNYLRCLDAEKKIRRGHVLDGCTTLYNIHGAATRLMRGWNMLRTSQATPKLAQVCDDYIEMRRAA